VILNCAKHNYVAAQRRTTGAVVAIPPKSTGCVECWKCYYVTDYALTPVDTQAQRLDELTEVIHHAVEYEKTGKFGKDFELFEPTDTRFKVEYERDGHPDKESK
jgi:hypothetical protein